MNHPIQSTIPSGEGHPPRPAPASAPAPAPARWSRAAVALVERDLLLLIRRPSRVAATIITPALLWAFFAGGFTDAVASTGPDAGDAYTRSLAAGAALLVVTFASIFGALSLIRDRETGYLQAVLVGPTPRWVVIAARVGSGALFAFLQAITMLAAVALLSEGVPAAGLVRSGLMLACAAIGLSGFCTALAWHFRSIEGFHGVMSGILMPAWMLSGAVFPPGTTQGTLGLLMRLNPLAYAHTSITTPLNTLSTLDSGAVESWAVPAIVTAVFGITGLAASVASARGDARR